MSIERDAEVGGGGVAGAVGGAKVDGVRAVGGQRGGEAEVARRIDGVDGNATGPRRLMVVAAHKTPRRLVEGALDIMDPAKTLGLVFNGDDRPLSGYSSSYYSRPYAREPSPEGSLVGRWRSTVRKVGDLVRRFS